VGKTERDTEKKRMEDPYTQENGVEERNCNLRRSSDIIEGLSETKKIERGGEGWTCSS